MSVAVRALGHPRGARSQVLHASHQSYAGSDGGTSQERRQGQGHEDERGDLHDSVGVLEDLLLLLASCARS
jgi:hypothetical protein